MYPGYKLGKAMAMWHGGVPLPNDTSTSAASEEACHLIPTTNDSAKALHDNI
jgi:hypothetical protein